MEYNFDILGVSTTLNFFYYQQEVEQNPTRSKAYLGSYECSLDGFIKSAELIPPKLDWNWDDVVSSIVNFWLKQEDSISYWKKQLENAEKENLIVARVVSLKSLRHEFERLMNL